MEEIILNNKVAMPQIGLGLYRLKKEEELENAVLWALEAGYRHLIRQCFIETSIFWVMRLIKRI